MKIRCSGICLQSASGKALVSCLLGPSMVLKGKKNNVVWDTALTRQKSKESWHQLLATELLVVYASELRGDLRHTIYTRQAC